MGAEVIEVGVKDRREDPVAVACNERYVVGVHAGRVGRRAAAAHVPEDERGHVRETRTLGNALEHLGLEQVALPERSVELWRTRSLGGWAPYASFCMIWFVIERAVSS